MKLSRSELIDRRERGTPSIGGAPQAVQTQGQAPAFGELTGLRQAPLIAHIIYRLDVGGLENGLVNLINHMPPGRYRHIIICLTDYSDFHKRITAQRVPVYALQKRDGKDWGLYIRLWKILRELKPDIVHTRNLAGLEGQIPALLAGVRCRVHGEHGRDVYDLHGVNTKYNRLRKTIRPLVHRYISVSRDLADWLVKTIGARPAHVHQIYNGVDSERFCPRLGSRPKLGPPGFATEQTVVIGTVGRMAGVKDQLTLVRAFLLLLDRDARARDRLRLMLVGDGLLRDQARQLLYEAGAEILAWLPGERSDIPEIMRALDIFVLPSLGEGISNTILEAMSSGLPVVATRVGGNPELVMEGETGFLVSPADPKAMAESIARYLTQPEMMQRHGRVGRKRVEACFSMDKMVQDYLAVYDAVLAEKHLRGV
jgi:sugar transferase (PEP-CTERM/EpsH1 system associated)